MDERCPKATCQSGAVVRYKLPGGINDEYSLRCSSCGSVWTPYFCATKNCQEQAAGLCLDCGKAFCLRHGQLGRTPICDNSRRKLRAIVRGNRG